MTRLPFAAFAVLFVFGLVVGVRAAPEPRRRAVVGDGMGPRARGEVPGSAAVAHGPTMQGSRRGSAVYPEQEIPLRFNHGQHLGLPLSCDKCHVAAADSTRARDFNFPTGAVCDECHGRQHPRPRAEPARCQLCHTKVDAEGRVTAGLRAPRPQLKFNHKLHLSKGASCEDASCHGSMSQVRLATTLQLPTEADCLTCHDGKQATQRCGACHITESSGRLQTRARDDRLLPALVPTAASSWGMEHDLAFVEDHAALSKANPSACETCHTETFCTDCHAGPIRPMRIHAGDFLTTHALSAQARTADCQSCHRTQSFCLACHERLGFGERAQGSFGVGGGLRFHPEGFSGPPGTPQSHAAAAQRNIAACSSCHTEDSCLACHATTAAASPGLDVSPHGPSFGASIRCQALANRNRRVCLKCHAPGDPMLDCR
ncbi:MAG: cytochrome c3 family protein [Myxococcota bacterium]